MEKSQPHLMAQDAATVDPSKLTALTPEVVRFLLIYYDILLVLLDLILLALDAADCLLCLLLVRSSTDNAKQLKCHLDSCFCLCSKLLQQVQRWQQLLSIFAVVRFMYMHVECINHARELYITDY